MDNVTGAQREKVILVVEDDESIRSILSRTIRNAGYSVVEIENGSDAADYLQTMLPDAILTDISMPFLDGIELCRLVKQRPATMDVPVVVLSAIDNEATQIRAFRAGADEYLIKTTSHSAMILKTIERVTSMDYKSSLVGDLHGRLGEDGFMEVVKTLIKNRESGWLRVRRDNVGADILFNEGVLIQSKCMGHEGDNETLLCTNWEGASFVFVKTPEASPKSISKMKAIPQTL